MADRLNSPTVPVQDAEYPLQLFYNSNFTPWLSIAPLLQYISHPGDTSACADVWAVGTNIGITLEREAYPPQSQSSA